MARASAIREAARSRSNSAKDARTFSINLSSRRGSHPGAVTTPTRRCAPEVLEQGGEVPQVPRQPVEAIDDKLLDASGPDHAQQSLKRRPIERRPGVRLVVEAILNQLESQ